MQEKKNDPAKTTHTLEELRMVVQDNRVCWEVLPERIPVKDEEPLKVGFDLMLYGAHEVGVHPTPGGLSRKKSVSRDTRFRSTRVPLDITGCEATGQMWS
jgi:hypothetical protein